MRRERSRPLWWILAPAFGVTALFGALAFLQPGAPSIPTTAAPRPGADLGAPLFSDWAAFEDVNEATRDTLARYYVDALLGHEVFRLPPNGLPPQLARGLLLDDDELLLSSGRRLWNRKLLHQPGLAGEFCYLHSGYCLKKLLDVAFFIDGAPRVIYDNQYRIERYPSHTTVHYFFPEVLIQEHKFITWNDRAVVAYAAYSRDGKPHTVTVEALAPYPPVPAAQNPVGFPLLARGTYQGLPLFVYLDAPGFTRVGADSVHLRRSLSVESKATPARAALAFRFENREQPQPDPPLAEDPLPAHTREYLRWFADNVPYFDSSDLATKKMWYYRWWIVRLHLAQANTPDLKGYAFYEGKLGFDNVIGFAVPAQIKELTYLRDPAYGLSQVENSYRNRSAEGAVLDPPGSPYWNETYSHWIAMALAEFHRVHPIPAATLRTLLPAAAADVRAWLDAYDPDEDGLPERDRPRVTGYDLDILSYWYFNGLKVSRRAEPPALERVDFASFVYANAAAVSALATEIGDQALADEFAGHAARVRAAVLEHLWDPESRFFYPQRADDDTRIPIRELHGFFPFMTGLAPNEEPYVDALDKLVDPAEFWSRFPPVITSLAHYRDWTWEMDGLTRNIAPHPISMGARTLVKALKHYDHTALTAQHFMELMARYNDLVYPGVHPGDALWRPNVHEYYSKWEPHSVQARPKPSDISHDFHSMYLSLIVEGAVGLTPRRDGKIELQPLAQSWTHFLLDRLRYRGHDLTIVWDQRDGRTRYTDRPEGLSVYIDGVLAFTHPALDHVLYDPEAKTLEILATQSGGTE